MDHICLRANENWIHSLGGRGKDGILNTVETFDIKKKSWIQSQSNLSQTSSSLITLNITDTFLIGGVQCIQEKCTRHNTIYKYDGMVNFAALNVSRSGHFVVAAPPSLFGECNEP